MVSDYQYRNLFAEHFAVDYIIVDSGATVTGNEGMLPTISGETFCLTNDDIKAESIKINESLCSDKNLVFGKIEAARLAFSFKNNSDLPTDLTTQEIDVYLYFNFDSSTLFKVGRYTIKSDRYSENNFVRSITAYDLLYYIKDLDITEWYYTYFGDGLKHKIIDILTDEEANDGKMGLFEYLREVEGLPFVLASGQTLINGDFMLGQTIESDSISFEFFMQRILEFNGAFGHINRAGEFEFVVLEWYDAEPARTIINDDRIPPTEHDIVSTWGIGGIDVYDQNNIRVFKTRNTNKKKPSIYNIVDSFVFAGRQPGDADVESALQELQRTINHYNYKSSNIKASGDLCVEVGDRINISLLPDEGEERGWFRSYVLIRTYSGIQGMTDVYQANGDKKQPIYQIDNDRWHDGDSDARATGGSSGGVSQLNDEHDRRFIELMRNYGYPMLDEPDVDLVYNKEDGQVEIKWEDPADLASYSPLPVAWAGTLVVRKEGTPPLHRWGTEHQTYGGTVLVDSTTRDAYKVNAYVDNTIQLNKRYYYAIMPYYVSLDDADHPIKTYRWTKVISVDTHKSLTAPTISEVTVSGVDAAVTYEIPVLDSGSYAACKLVAKKGAIPTSKTDGQKIIDISASGTSATVTWLDEQSRYYFVIFTADTDGNTASSDPKDITTGEFGQYDLLDISKTTDINDSVNWSYDHFDYSHNFYDIPSEYQPYFTNNPNKVIWYGQYEAIHGNTKPTLSNKIFNFTSRPEETSSILSFPFEHNMDVKEISFDILVTDRGHSDQWCYSTVYLQNTNGTGKYAVSASATDTPPNITKGVECHVSFLVNTENVSRWAIEFSYGVYTVKNLKILGKVH